MANSRTTYQDRSGGDGATASGEGFAVGVDRDAAVLEQVRQDLQADPELVGAELAAVLPCVVDHAAEGHGPVLGALNNAVEDVEEAVFSPDRARPTERIYRLSRQVLEFRRAVARSPRCSTWVAIWAIPTLLAGIYGMNFRHLPELEWTFGYPLVLVVMALICMGLYRGFRRNGWL
jgi:Mg2+ and Co2+ transporter CorA